MVGCGMRYTAQAPLIAFVLGPAFFVSSRAAASEASLEAIVIESLENERAIDAGLRRWALHDALQRGFAMSEVLTEEEADEARAIRQMKDEDWLDSLEKELIVRSLRAPRPAALPTGITYDIPLSDHPLVDVYIDYFSGRGRRHFEKWLARAERYRPIMIPILEENGLPLDTFYLAMIESGLSSRAYSVAAASGFWQFIRSTAEIFDMRMDHWVDERRDFITATRAACRYLNQLHNQFGDWHLAWASYNAGAGRVSRALKRSGSTGYWQLVDREALPKETRHYVAKIIAAAIVAKNAPRYGFGPIQGESRLYYDEFTVDRAIDLRRLAQALEVQVSRLRELNPSLLHDLTPPRRRSTLRVPEGLNEDAQAWIKEQSPLKLVDLRPYRVRRGDTLSAVARRFGVSIASLRDFNDIRSVHALRVGQKLVVPVRLAKKRRRSGNAARRTVVASSRERRHVVAAGETLWSISRRYRCTVPELKRWNRLGNHRIRIGQVLTVRR